MVEISGFEACVRVDKRLSTRKTNNSPLEKPEKKADKQVGATGDTYPSVPLLGIGHFRLKVSSSWEPRTEEDICSESFGEAGWRQSQSPGEVIVFQQG